MRTIIDTIKATSGMVEELFGEAPTTKDIHEGFARPCTYVQPILMSAGPSGPLRDDMFTIQIIRFAARSEKGYLELLQYQEQLRERLEDPIPVSEDFNLYPEDVSFDINREDMALVVSFSVENVQLRVDSDTSEGMADINITIKKE